jgi:hypothetical protein
LATNNSGTLSLGAIQQSAVGHAVRRRRRGAELPVRRRHQLRHAADDGAVLLHARDAFRTDTMYRTDVSVNYSIGLPSTRRARLFAQVQVLNLFNQFALFNLANNEINTSALTARSTARSTMVFNPFTTTPVQGVHWDKDEDFGKSTAAGAYTLPRTFQFSVGFASELTGDELTDLRLTD